jgi:hypothetical protein
MKKKKVEVTVLGNKTIIDNLENERTNLLVHIPRKDFPLRMCRIKHFITRENSIEFYGNSLVKYEIDSLKDPAAIAAKIRSALEDNKPNLILVDNDFIEKNAENSGDTSVD